MVEDNAHAKALGAVFWCFLSEKLGIRFHRFSPSSQLAIQGGAGILSWLQIEGPSKTSARRIQARTDRFVGKPRVLCQIRAPGCVHRSSFRLSYLLSLLTCFFIWSSMVFGQVALDSATSIGQQVSGATPSITLPHTTAGTNRVLVVGVSINITNNTGALVTAVTYAGAALTSSGAHNDAGNSRRVEMWYLVSPAIGNNHVLVT